MLFLFQGCLRLSFKKWTGFQDGRIYRIDCLFEIHPSLAKNLNSKLKNHATREKIQFVFVCRGFVVLFFDFGGCSLSAV